MRGGTSNQLRTGALDHDYEGGGWTPFFVARRSTRMWRGVMSCPCSKVVLFSLSFYICSSPSFFQLEVSRGVFPGTQRWGEETVLNREWGELALDGLLVAYCLSLLLAALAVQALSRSQKSVSTPGFESFSQWASVQYIHII
jgi:hypothetical protein